MNIYTRVASEDQRMAAARLVRPSAIGSKSVDVTRDVKGPASLCRDDSEPLNLHVRVVLAEACSKRLDLADRLASALDRLRRAQRDDARPVVSVRSGGRSQRDWRVADRLSEADVRQLLVAFEAGTPKWKLAERYDISLSSVKRLLRKHRAAQARSET